MPVCEIDRLLAGSAAEVLETMFFAGVLGSSEALIEQAISTRLDFEGNPSGSFGLSVSLETGHQLARDFLGEDGISQARVEEVIGELTNMLCGSLLSRLESESAFELQHPELAPVPHKPAYARTFDLENGKLGVWLILGEPE